MLVLEGKKPWERSLRDGRSDQGLLLLPQPVISSCKMRRATRSGDGLLCGLMRHLCEKMDKEIMRMVVSFI